MTKKSWPDLIDKLKKERILTSPSVIKAMRSISRESFLPENMRPYNATDTPLPIGFGQTVSAPHSFGTRPG